MHRPVVKVGRASHQSHRTLRRIRPEGRGMGKATPQPKCNPRTTSQPSPTTERGTRVHLTPIPAVVAIKTANRYLHV